MPPSCHTEPGTIQGELYFNKSWGAPGYGRRGSLTVFLGGKLESRGFIFYKVCTISVQPNAKLSLGSQSYMNMGGTIHCFNSITIGDECAISENVTFRDSDNHTILREGYVMSSPIVIGNHVWIGLNSTILKGVHLGDGCIVAAGSVVTKSFPPKTLIGGVPAKVIRTNVEWK